MDNGIFVYDMGVIHGRFQVLHNDHLAYLLAGKTLCRHLVVAITNPEPGLVQDEETDPHRSHPLANPLTYYERYLMVKVVLSDEGFDGKAFSIVPLPIHFPKRYHHYVPLEAVFFLSIYDPWGERKRQYFNSLGLKTHILRQVASEEKGLSATDIRRAMIEDRPWRHWVPPGAAHLLTAWDIPSRLKAMAQTT